MQQGPATPARLGVELLGLGESPFSVIERRDYRVFSAGAVRC